LFANYEWKLSSTLLCNISKVLSKRFALLIRGSYFIFKMPWPGDPQINIQRDCKMAKSYPVRMVKKALERLEAEIALSSIVGSPP